MLVRSQSMDAVSLVSTLADTRPVVDLEQYGSRVDGAASRQVAERSGSVIQIPEHTPDNMYHIDSDLLESISAAEEQLLSSREAANTPPPQRLSESPRSSHSYDSSSSDRPLPPEAVDIIEDIMNILGKTVTPLCEDGYSYSEPPASSSRTSTSGYSADSPVDASSPSSPRPSATQQPRQPRQRTAAPDSGTYWRSNFYKLLQGNIAAERGRPTAEGVRAKVRDVARGSRNTEYSGDPSEQRAALLSQRLAVSRLSAPKTRVPTDPRPARAQPLHEHRKASSGRQPASTNASARNMPAAPSAQAPRPDASWLTGNIAVPPPSHQSHGAMPREPVLQSSDMPAETFRSATVEMPDLSIILDVEQIEQRMRSTIGSYPSVRSTLSLPGMGVSLTQQEGSAASGPLGGQADAQNNLTVNDLSLSRKRPSDKPPRSESFEDVVVIDSMAKASSARLRKRRKRPATTLPQDPARTTARPSAVPIAASSGVPAAEPATEPAAEPEHQPVLVIQRADARRVLRGSSTSSLSASAGCTVSAQPSPAPASSQPEACSASAPAGAPADQAGGYVSRLITTIQQKVQATARQPKGKAASASAALMYRQQIKSLQTEQDAMRMIIADLQGEAARSKTASKTLRRRLELAEDRRCALEKKIELVTREKDEALASERARAAKLNAALVQELANISLDHAAAAAASAASPQPSLLISAGHALGHATAPAALSPRTSPSLDYVPPPALEDYRDIPGSPMRALEHQHTVISNPPSGMSRVIIHLPARYEQAPLAEPARQAISVPAPQPPGAAVDRACLDTSGLEGENAARLASGTPASSVSPSPRAVELVACVAERASPHDAGAAAPKAGDDRMDAQKGIRDSPEEQLDVQALLHSAPELAPGPEDASSTHSVENLALPPTPAPQLLPPQDPAPPRDSPCVRVDASFLPGSMYHQANRVIRGAETAEGAGGTGAEAGSQPLLRPPPAPRSLSLNSHGGFYNVFIRSVPTPIPQIAVSLEELTSSFACLIPYIPCSTVEDATAYGVLKAKLAAILSDKASSFWLAPFYAARMLTALYCAYPRLSSDILADCGPRVVVALAREASSADTGHLLECLLYARILNVLSAVICYAWRRESSLIVEALRDIMVFIGQETILVQTTPLPLVLCVICERLLSDGVIGRTRTDTLDLTHSGSDGDYLAQRTDLSKALATCVVLLGKRYLELNVAPDKDAISLLPYELCNIGCLTVCIVKLLGECDLDSRLDSMLRNLGKLIMRATGSAEHLYGYGIL